MKIKPERLEKQKRYDKEYVERKKAKGLTRTLFWIKSNSVDKVRSFIKEINSFSDPIGQ